MQHRCANVAMGLAAMIVLSVASRPAAAVVLTVQIERTDGGGVVTPDAPLTYEIKGYLTDITTELGLSFFLYDLEVVNSPQPVNLSTAVLHGPGPDIASFVPDWGYAHDFNGTPSGNDLLQAGGAQNTIGNCPAGPPCPPGLPSFPSGPVVLGIGNSVDGVVLHEGSLTLPADAAPGSYTFQLKPNSLLANVVTAYDGVRYTVAAASAVVGSGITFSFATCLTADDCGDTDLDGIADDNCFWYACDTGTCDARARVFGDAGGAFGACDPDTFVNIHDRNHALTCFDGTSVCDDLNIDIGGPFGACAPDGFCNIHDANHALTGFSGTNPCACPAGAAPTIGHQIVGSASLVAAARQRSIRPGGEIEVDVFLNEPLDDLRGYQLDVAVHGGRSGVWELKDIRIEQRADHVFAGLDDTFDAFNTQTGQMLCGLDGTGVATSGRAYLATYTYGVSADASGTFTVDVRREGQTFLIASDDGEVDLTSSSPAVAVVAHGRNRRLR